MTQAWFDSAKVPALYNKAQMPLNVWRGGTITEVSEEHQQTEMDPTGKGGKGELKWWDSPANTQPKMQVYVTVQTTERNPADPDDNGLRRIYIRKDGHAPGSVFTETGNALKAAVVRTGLEVGGELYQMFTGTTPAKNSNFEDRKLWKMAYRPPANQFFATEVPAALAPQASSNGQPPPMRTPEEYRQPTYGQGYGPPAPQSVDVSTMHNVAAPTGYVAVPPTNPLSTTQQPWAQPAVQVQQAPQQHAPVADQQWPPAAEQAHPAQQPATAPQWPSAPSQSQPPTAAPPPQQPAAQGQQWPPGGQQAYQPPPVDPRNPFG